MRDQLIALESDLRAKGLVAEADEVHELVDEAEAIEQPASFLVRAKDKVGDLARGQWSLVQQEIEETREVYDLLRRRASGELTELDPIEREKVRAQLLDVFKIVPAGALSVANFVAPIPCSSWLTPALLMGLGLMPSSWKEAHLQSRLSKLMRRLNDEGYLKMAGDVQVILDDLEAETHHRERLAAVASDTQLLAMYDLDGDGTLDPDEQARMHAVVDRTVESMRKLWPRRTWYLFVDGDVSGPFTLPDIEALQCPDSALLSRGKKKEWVPLRWVLREIEDLDRSVRPEPEPEPGPASAEVSWVIDPDDEPPW